ncbi:MAG: hypothetical protein ABI397_00185 [Candidatus Saccharimonas sp.]
MEPRQESAPMRGEVPRPLSNSAEIIASDGVEVQTSRSIEQIDLDRRNAGMAQAAALGAAPALPMPIVPQSLPQPVVPPVTDDSMPADAGDDDLIEKEWVDKAKQIIAKTKDDPYTREREVSKLQIEYIRRRYGRQMGVSESD